jgi:hypothetical protein
VVKKAERSKDIAYIQWAKTKKIANNIDPGHGESERPSFHLTSFLIQVQ